MPDREKVIADLRRFINYPEPLSGTVKDALELLKEQEPVKPIIKTQELNGEIIKYHGCGICKTPLPKTFRFCQMCGKKVDWDAARQEESDKGINVLL